MSATSTRLLRLLALMQARRDWTGAELAERFGVTTRTVRSDIERLRELGYRVRSSTGAAGGYRLEAGSAVPPLLLDDDEVVAVTIGLQAAASGSVTGIEETSLRALMKIEQTMPSRLRHRVDALRAVAVSAANPGGPTVDAEMLASVADAARRREQLRFDYTGRGGEHTERRTEPHRLVYTGRRWYLLAWDVDRVDWRTFRADRIRLRTPNGPRFEAREPPEGAVEHVLRGIGSRAWHYQASILLGAPVEAAADRLPVGSGTLEQVGEHRCRWRTGSDSLTDLTAFITGLDLPFSVEAPEALREHLRGLAARYGAAASAVAERPGSM